jgi:hypothetical protein
MEMAGTTNKRQLTTTSKIEFQERLTGRRINHANW